MKIKEVQKRLEELKDLKYRLTKLYKLSSQNDSVVRDIESYTDIDFDIFISKLMLCIDEYSRILNEAIQNSNTRL